MSFKMHLLSLREIAWRDDRQYTVLEWCKQAFALPNGDPDEALPETRVLRAFEEMVELVQVMKIEPELLMKQIRITYARPVGDLHQEIGGVMVTMNAFSQAVSESLARCENDEIERCNSKDISHFQRRQKEKREQGL